MKKLLIFVVSLVIAPLARAADDNKVFTSKLDTALKSEVALVAMVDVEAEDAVVFIVFEIKKRFGSQSERSLSPSEKRMLEGLQFLRPKSSSKVTCRGGRIKMLDVINSVCDQAKWNLVISMNGEFEFISKQIKLDLKYYVRFDNIYIQRSPPP
jgi:hypothetical protein